MTDVGQIDRAADARVGAATVRREGVRPVARTRIEVADAAGAAAALERWYGPGRVASQELPGVAPSVRVASVSVGELRVDRVAHSLRLHATVEPSRHLAVWRGLAGAPTVSFGGAAHLVGPGNTLLVPAGVPSEVDAEPSEVAVLSVPFARVAAIAEARAGVRPGGLWFTGVRPVSSAAHDYWTRTLALVVDALEPPLTLAAHPVLHEHLLETVAVASLLTFPNTAIDHPAARSAHPA